LIFLFSIVAVSLSGQVEIPKEDPPRDEVIVRSYDTQRYFKERRWSTGSGSEMPMREDIDEVIREIESKIKEREQEIKVAPVTISLVFHMMNTTDAEAAQRSIQSQIEALNRDFNNESQLETHPNDPEGKYTRLAASTQITFITAEDTEYGSGIATLQSSATPWTSWDQMKDPESGGSTSIEPSRYINIWVCDLPADMASYSSSIYCIDKEDGIVIDDRYFGSTEEGNYTEGKTLTHLIGNYLGLHDLWNEYELCKDDYVDDTPISNAENTGKPKYKHITTCDKENLTQEMTMNFMDNTDDSYQTLFTKGQVDRIHAVIEEVRPSLILKSSKTAGHEN